MKSLVFALSVFLVPLATMTTSAQIVNGNFESWTGTTPTGWTTDNLPSFYTPVTKVTGRTGFAVQGTVVNFSGFLVPPVITSYSPATQRYGSLTGFFKYTGVQSDSLLIFTYLKKGSSPIADGYFTYANTVTGFTAFSVDYQWLTSDTPDSCWIEILIVGADSVHVGSTFTIDDLALSGSATAVNQQVATPGAFALNQNYPNPFNPSTRISYELASASHVRLTVYDILGRQVASLVDAEEQAGNHLVRFDGAGLSSGVYIYRLQTEGFVQQKRMMLLK